MKLTDAEYPVSWDQGDDHAPAFCARLEVTPDGRLARWNGFVRPWFTRAEVDRYRAWSDAQHAAGDVDYDRVEWSGDVLTVHDGYSDEDGPYTLFPKWADGTWHPVDGLYPLGAGYWTWTVVGPDPEDDPAELAAEDDYLASLHV